jgi:formimidoylglutamate deiminase
MARLTFENLWVNGRWEADATVETADGSEHCEYVRGLTLPGIASAHCHAFQRLLPAWTQRARGANDSFWTWRSTLYAAAASMGPAELEAIAARCYLDLLRGGYTGVAEFLYLHRVAARPEDPPNADQAVARAAKRVGISLTLLPALYQHSDFGRVPPAPAQQPFIRSTAQFVQDWVELAGRYPADDSIGLGIAFHSLRAVDIETVADVYGGLATAPACRVLHIHAAEQPAEVSACRRHWNRAPIELLLERELLDPRWTIVHGTHATQAELEGVYAQGTTLAVCPTTEADLGDGCLDAGPYFLRGGDLAIGSDSNVCCNAFAELRLLEWSQRLLHRRRNVLTSPSEPRVADGLYRRVHASGWKSLGKLDRNDAQPPPADFVTFDDDAADWREQPPENYLSALMFASGEPRARHVMVDGRWLIRDGAHANEAEIESEYRAALARLRPNLLQTQ